MGTCQSAMQVHPMGSPQPRGGGQTSPLQELGPRAGEAVPQAWREPQGQDPGAEGREWRGVGGATDSLNCLFGHSTDAYNARSGELIKAPGLVALTLEWGEGGM